MLKTSKDQDSHCGWIEQFTNLFSDLHMCTCVLWHVHTT